MRKIEVLLTPQEIIDKYPEIGRNFNWTASDLGMMLKCELLDGYYDRGKRIALIKESSVIKLIEYVNLRLQSKIIVI